LQLSTAGKTELQQLGRKTMARNIKQALGAKLDPVAVAKKFRYVDVIPVNPQGKRQPDVIRGLFD
jgi:acyl-coenzyme A synthetase/AMP-(fatty) acid ligase